MADEAQFMITLVDKMSGPANSATSAVGGLEQKMAATEGASGGATSGIQGMGASLAELGPYAAAAAVALAAVASAGLLLFEGGKLAIEATELKQDTLDSLEAFLGTQEAAQSTYAAIKGMGADIALTIEDGSKMAQQLAAAGVDTEASMTAAVHAIASVKSVLGEAAGSKLETIVKRTAQTGEFKLQGKQLTGTGVRVGDVEAQLAKQLGVVPAVVKKMMAAGKINAKEGILALETVINEGKIGALAKKQALDFGNQIKLATSNIKELFSDIDTGPFLDALHGILSVFDSNTAAGSVLKTVITAIFDKLFKLAAKVLPLITFGFKQLIIWGLKAYIAIKTFANENQQMVDYFVQGAKMIGIGILIVVGAFALLVGVVVAASAGMIAAFGAYVAAVVAGIGWISEQLSGFVDWITGLASSWYEAGANLINGLVDGIMSGVGKAVDAVKGAAQSMLDSFTGIFSIHSPSKVMAAMGGHLMGGLEMGIASNDNGPQDAMAKSLTPAQPPSSGPAQAASGGKGDVTVVLEAGAIVIHGIANVEQLKQELPGVLAATFEGMGITLGAA